MKRRKINLILLVVVCILVMPYIVGNPYTLPGTSKSDLERPDLMFPPRTNNLAEESWPEPPEEPYPVGHERLDEHGTSAYKGGGVWRYGTNLGETNVWDGSSYRRYIYNETGKYVLIGNLNFTHETNGVIAINHGMLGSMIGELKWYAQYYLSDQWNNFTFDNYEYVGANKTKYDATIYQRWWSTNGELNVSYTYTNFNSLKMRAKATSWYDGSLPVRVLWVLSDIGFSPEYTLVYSDGVAIGVELGNGQRVYWHDVTLNTPDININPILDKPNNRTAVVFGNLSSILSQYETMDIDPQYSLAADSDDCHWDDPYGTPVIDTTDTFLRFGNETAGDWRAYLRFSLAVPQGSTILESYLYGYNIEDDVNGRSHNVYRVDETNVGKLELDSTMPSVDTTPTVTFESDGGTFDWDVVNVTDIVQEQVNLNDWVTGYYVGFAVESPTYGASDSFSWQDESHANPQECEFWIDYLEGDIYQVPVAADSDDDGWGDPYGTPSHTTNGITILFRNDTSETPEDYRGQVRFSIDIPRGSTIVNATLYGFEEQDDAGTNTHYCYRIDETNVGSLEADSSMPSIDTTPTVTFTTAGDLYHWNTINVTDLVQAQVDLNDWVSGYYIGFAFETPTSHITGRQGFQDYQDSATEKMYLEIEYEVGDWYQSRVAADSDDDCWDDPYGTPSHTTGTTQIQFWNWSVPGESRGQVRLSLAIPRGSTIQNATLVGWLSGAVSSASHDIYRIDETNVGSLEGDSSMPSLDTSTADTFSTDGVSSIWKGINVTDLVQDQVNLDDWRTGYYIGFAFETPTEVAGSGFEFEDYSDSTDNNMYIEVNYTVGNYTQYPIASDDDDAYANYNGGGFSLTTQSTTVDAQLYTGGSVDYHGFFRFYVTLPSTHSITNATLYLYEMLDATTSTVKIWRIAGDHWNVAPENLQSRPSLDSVTPDQYTTDGGGSEWISANITDLFIDFFDEAGYAAANYFGIEVNRTNDSTNELDFSDKAMGTDWEAYIEVYAEAQDEAPEYDYVDNNASDVDSSSDIGTHSSFTDQQSAPDSTYDTLTEADLADGFWSWFEDHYDQENTDVDTYGDYGTQTNPTQANDSLNSLYMNLLEYNMAVNNDFNDWFQSYTSDVDSSADVGTETNPENAQDFPDSDYMNLQEADQGLAATDYNDWFQSYSSNVDGVADVGTETNPQNAQDLGDSDYMTLQEANQGGGASDSEWINVHTYDGTYAAWQTYTGASPYLDAQDHPTNYIHENKDELIDVGWFNFTATSGSGTLTVNCSIWGFSDDTDDGVHVYVDKTGSGSGADNGTLIFPQNSGDYRTLALGTMSVSEINNLRIYLKTTDTVMDDLEIDHMRLGVSWTPPDDYELNFEYQWTDANYSETTEYVCIYVDTAAQTASETLKVWEWSGSAWAQMGDSLIDANGWNNFTPTYLTGSTFTIKINDSLQSDEGAQDTWSIDSIILHTYSAGTTDYELNFEYQWTNANYSETNEEVCINVLAYQQTASETLKAWEWDGGDWVALGTLSGNGWNNFTASYLTGSTYTIMINDTLQSDESAQDDWDIDSIILHTWTSQADDYELDFEYQWTSALFGTGSTGNVCIYVQTADQTGGENLKAWEWDGADWVALGTLDSDGWNNFTCTELDSATYYIKVNDTLQSSDGTQDSWNIDLITLATWNTTNYRLDLEIQWTNVEFSRPIEQICIYAGTLGAEDIEVYIWNTTASDWDELWTDLTASGWNNISVSGWVDSSTITLRFLDDNQTNDGTTQDTWQIDSSVFRSASGAEESQDLFDAFTIAEMEYLTLAISRLLEEAITIAETFSRTIDIIITLFEGLAIAFMLSKAKMLETTLYDAISVAETFTSVFTANRSYGEAIDISETFYSTLEWARTWFDSISVDETVYLYGGYSRTYGESIAFAETFTGAASMAKNLFEAVAIAFTKTDTLQIARDYFETFSVDETVYLYGGYNRTYYEDITFAETITTVATVTTTLFEVITVEFTKTDTLQWAKNYFESISVDETVTNVFGAARNFYEDVTIDYNITLEKSLFRTYFEAFTVNETIYNAYGASRNLYDSLTVADGISKTLTLERSYFEDIALAEVESLASAFNRTYYDVITITETFYSQVSIVQTMFEDITIVFSLVNTADMKPLLYEAIGIAETITNAATFARTYFESMTINETMTALQSIVQSLFEAITVSEIKQNVIDIARTLFESVTIVFSDTNAATFPRTLFESITVYETAYPEKNPGGDDYEKDLFEAFTVSDGITNIATFVRTWFESLTMDETQYNVQAVVASLFEAITVSDGVGTVADFMREWSEGITVDETFNKISNHIRTLFESFTIADSVQASALAMKELFEAITVSEVGSLIVDYARSYFETITIVFRESTMADYIRNLGEAIAVYETTTNQKSSLLNLFESITATEAWSRVVDIIRSFFEVITISESYTLQYPQDFVASLFESIRNNETFGTDYEYPTTTPSGPGRPTEPVGWIITPLDAFVITVFSIVAVVAGYFGITNYMDGNTETVSPYALGGSERKTKKAVAGAREITKATRRKVVEDKGIRGAFRKIGKAIGLVSEASNVPVAGSIRAIAKAEREVNKTMLKEMRMDSVRKRMERQERYLQQKEDAERAREERRKRQKKQQEEREKERKRKKKEMEKQRKNGRKGRR